MNITIIQSRNSTSKKGGEKMPRKIERKAFVFYASFLEALEKFPLERQKKIAMALIEYGLEDYYDFGEFTGALSALEPLERLTFSSAIRDIDVQRRRYHNKYLIKGAIETIQNVISQSSNLNKDIKEKYFEIIEILEQRYYEIMKNDERFLTEELMALLPEEIYRLFHGRYELKTWKDQIKEILEVRLENENRNIPDDVKEKMYSELLKDYVETGHAFDRLSEIIEKFDDGYKN